jgi:hypothetical protein
MRVPETSKLHGTFNLVTGLWPVFHLRSFERVTGPKADGWLVKTVGLLLGVIGAVQILDAENEAPSSELLGVGTAAALMTIDVVYASRRRISLVYLLDAVGQAGWIAAWATSRMKAADNRSTRLAT